ncbi:MAG TPA: NAD-dependent epimerase/dehydratase family protein, partial [Candidatus Omnitrophota bacterium]|nr:NAD-dependent epimerase/dehydratase family protein [Candidatus Omnitrophota bacterium]
IGRFVFVSSIKVNGESTPPDRPFRADDPPAPADSYGIAKAEAEAALARIPGLGLAVVRPPLVHGPGAKGNLAALMRVIAKGWPLPLGAIVNRRSLVGVENLADCLAFLAEHGCVGTFLVRDEADVSTPELVRLVAAAMGRPARLVPVPQALLRLAGMVTGKAAAVERVTGSLVVDDAPLRALGWRQRVSLADGIAAMARQARC